MGGTLRGGAQSQVRGLRQWWTEATIKVAPSAMDDGAWRVGIGGLSWFQAREEGLQAQSHSVALWRKVTQDPGAPRAPGWGHAVQPGMQTQCCYQATELGNPEGM